MNCLWKFNEILINQHFFLFIPKFDWKYRFYIELLRGSGIDFMPKRFGFVVHSYVALFFSHYIEIHSEPAFEYMKTSVQITTTIFSQCFPLSKIKAANSKTENTLSSTDKCSLFFNSFFFQNHALYFAMINCVHLFLLRF